MGGEERFGVMLEANTHGKRVSIEFEKIPWDKDLKKGTRIPPGQKAPVVKNVTEDGIINLLS